MLVIIAGYCGDEEEEGEDEDAIAVLVGFDGEVVDALGERLVWDVVRGRFGREVCDAIAARYCMTFFVFFE